MMGAQIQSSFWRGRYCDEFAQKISQGIFGRGSGMGSSETSIRVG
jgi:hypothetical protein